MQQYFYCTPLGTVSAFVYCACVLLAPHVVEAHICAHVVEARTCALVRFLVLDTCRSTEDSLNYASIDLQRGSTQRLRRDVGHGGAWEAQPR